MINQKDNYVEWALLLYQLDDARQHLEQLIKKMSEDADYGEEEFQIDLGHVYAHLNRAWRLRNEVAGMPVGEWERFSRFPDDLKPVG